MAVIHAEDGAEAAAGLGIPSAGDAAASQGGKGRLHWRLTVEGLAVWGFGVLGFRVLGFSGLGVWGLGL